LRKKDPLGAPSPHLLIMMNGRFFGNRERYSDFKLKIVCHHFTFIYDTSSIWQYGLWSFQTEYTKLERFLHKNQHTQRKLLNFENWTNGEPQQLAKIKGFKYDYFDFSCIILEKLV
jgi:hypothetical protein